MRHLLSIEDVSREDIERILARAKAFEEVSRRPIKKVPALQGKTVVNLFYEASTRTSTSFDLAAKRLSAEVHSIRSSGSAVDKGESLKDTVQTLSAYDPDAIVIRSPHVGAADLVARWSPAAVVNAGDGKHEHPTQACSTSTPCASASARSTARRCGSSATCCTRASPARECWRCAGWARR